MRVTDEQIMYAAQNSRSAAEAARMIGINYKTYRDRASKLGVFTTNQGGAGLVKKRSRVYNIDDYVFSSIDHETAYWIGFIAADGSIVEKSLKFMLQYQDVEILERFKKFAKSDYPIGKCKSHYTDSDGTKYFDACYIKVTSNQIVNDLSKFGIVQGKKYLDIDFLYYIPDEFKLDFLFGFFDGDGGVLVNNNRRTINIACNKALSASIQKLLISIGIYSASVANRSTIDVIFIGNSSYVDIFTQLYKDRNEMYPVMSRKLKKLLRED